MLTATALDDVWEGGQRVNIYVILGRCRFSRPDLKAPQALVTFKENCPDLRNNRVVDIVAELQDYGIKCDVHDPWPNTAEVEEEYGIPLAAEPATKHYDAVILAVSHQQFT